MSRRLALLLASLVIIIIVSVTLWFGTPRLEEVSPADQAVDVAPETSLRLSFSRRMQAESVQERLSISPRVDGSFNWEGNELVFTPDSPWQAGQSVQVSLPSGARAAGLLPLAIQADNRWEFTVRQPRLAFLFPSDGAANIYLLEPGVGDRTGEVPPPLLQITDNPSGILDFDVEASGEAIYYSARVGQGGSAIYRLALTTPESAPIAILDCPQALCTSPRISPNSDFLAYERTAYPGANEPDYPRVWLLPLSVQKSAAGEPAETPVVVTQAPYPVDDTQNQTLLPHWSPQGLVTYYDSSQKAFIALDPGSGQRDVFPNQTGEPGSWNPDGQMYVVPEILDNTVINPAPDPANFPAVSSHLIRFNRLDGSSQDLTGAEDLEDASPAYSPDGGLLAFARKYLDVTRWTPGRQLWLMGADGQDPHPVSNDPYFNHFNFAWDPEGTRIAYVRFNQTVPTDPPVIWLLDLESGQTSQLVIGGYSPKWIP